MSRRADTPGVRFRPSDGARRRPWASVEQRLPPGSVLGISASAHEGFEHRRGPGCSDGVSFVVPVHNGAAWIRDTLEAIWAQADGRPMEVVVVDDRSDDGSSEILRSLAARWPLRIIEGEGRGAAAAINAGVRAAIYPVICQVDQDVVVGPGWMSSLVAELDDPTVAAAQGYYATDSDASLCARVMALDLEQRYASIRGDTDHVCTGNSVYHADALHQVELFDESLGYGYDNDMSYRLREAGHRLAFCREARSVHGWREGFAGYWQQQYGFGYGRLELLVKHPSRLAGDAVSPAAMMLHPVLMLAALAAFVGALVVKGAGGPWQSLPFVGSAIVSCLALERLAAGIAAARRFGDPSAVLFPVFHLARDVAWVGAVLVWLARRVSGRPSRPFHSMRARPIPSERWERAPAERADA